jgi:uncharacterized repeat protein (TIGR01451 family)
LLAVAGLPLLLFTGSAAASGSLTISVSSGSAGQRVVLSGGGFAPGESVQPYWDYGMTGSLAEKSFYVYNPIVTAGAAGTATSDLFVPVVPSGSATVSLVGLTSNVVDTANFTVVPRLDTGAAMAPAGTTLTLTGWGFGPREAVNVQWPGAAIVKASTDSKGYFQGKTFTIPAGTAAGTYTVTATGLTSNITTSATVTVGPTPTGPAPGPDDWPNWGYDLQQHRENTAETAFNTSNVGQLSPAWQASIPAPDKVQATPSIANGVVYIASVHGLLNAYNETTGALLWSFQAPGPVYASPAIVNGIAYFGTVNVPQESQAGNYAFALNAKTGAVIWADALLDGGVWAVPLVANGRVMFTMANREALSGGMVAFDALTGRKLWEDDIPEGVWGPPTLDPGGQYYYQGTANQGTGLPCPPPGTCAGQILKVNMADGSFTTLFTSPDVSGDDDIPAAPTYDNGNLIFGGKGGSVYSISASTGAPNWQYDTGFSGDFGIFGSTAVSNGLVFFQSIGARAIFALNESNGKQVWSSPSTGGGPNSPVVADGIVFVAGYGGQLLAFAASNGAQLWSASLGAAAGGSAAVANGMVFQATYGNVLEAFAISAGTAPTFTADTPPTAASTNGPYSYTFAASGTPAPTYALASGGFPPGLNIDPNTGVLSGTPTTTGTYSFTVSASNGVGTPALTPTITITVSNGLAITSAPNGTAIVGQVYSFTVTTAGSPVPSLSATGGLPDHITFSDNGDGTATLSGTAALGQEGSYPLTITAHNGVSPNASQAFVLTVNGVPPALTADSPATALPVNAPYSYQFTASGDPAPTFAVASGALPTGMTLSLAGLLNGTPTTPGKFTFTVSASDGYGPAAVSPSITITVYAPTDMSVGLVGPTSAKSGATVVYTVTAYNLGPATAGQITATFTLPAGAAFVSALNGGVYANGVVTWTAATIASGSHLNFKVSISFSVTGTNTVVGGAQAVNADPNPGNNSVSLNTTVS